LHLDCDDREFYVPAIDGLATNKEGEEMRSLTLAVLIVVMLLVAAAVQASDKDIAVPRNHPAATVAAPIMAAPIIGAQMIGTQSLKTTPRSEISVDDQRGNNWWSDQFIIRLILKEQGIE
jgi:hypothetical protein